MWKTSKTAYLLFCIPYLAASMYLFYLGFTVSPNALTYDGYYIKNSFYLEGLSCIIVPFITIAGILLYKKIKDKEIDLTQNGIKGEAEILDMEETGIYSNNHPQIKFLLKITLPNRSQYQIEHKEVVNFISFNSPYVGAIVPIFVDPDNHTKVMLS